MKIILISSAYHPYYRGGGEHSVKILAEGLAQREHAVRIITAHEQASVEHINGVQVHRVRHPNIYWSYRSERKSAAQKLAWHLLEAYNPRVRSRVWPILEQEKPDVLHVRNVEDFSPYIARVAATLKIPVVVTLNSYTWLCPRATMFRHDRSCPQQCTDCWWMTQPKKHMSKYVDAVVGVSQFMVDTHRAYGYFPRARSEVVYTSVVPTPGPLPAQIEPGVRFGYIGRLHPTKGVLETIQGFRALSKPHRLYVAGEGPEDYEQQCRAAAAGADNIIFLGKVPAPDFYKQVDVVIVSSRWHEPFPRVLVEAYAHGRPVLAARRGGITEMVRPATGWLFDPQAPEQLTQNLQAIAAQGADALAGMQPSIARFLREELPDEVSRYEHIYQSLIV